MVGGADHRRPVVVLGLPAPGQPLARRAGRRTSSTSRCARTTATPSRCCASSPRPPTRRRTARKGTRWSYRRDFGGVRLLVIDSRCGRILADRRPQHGVRGRVRLDRGAGRRRLRPPADRHVAAVAAAAGAARPRVVERGAGRRAARGRGWPAGPRSCAGPPTSSTGRRSAQSFDRLAELFAQRRPRRPRRPRTASRAGYDLRAVRRRPPRLRRPGALSATTLPVAGLPADLLAAAQLRARRS